VNQQESEKKAKWVTAGAFVLFAALGFLALGGGFGLYAFFSRPS
jgi:chromate transport protein ChrA